MQEGEVIYDNEPYEPEPPKNNNTRNIIIAVVILLVLMCCCCACLGGLLFSSEDVINEVINELDVFQLPARITALFC